MSARRAAIRGMTGFGAGSAERDGLRFEVEIKGVNNRFLDQRVKLPSEYAGLENEIKQRVQSRIARGRVDTVVVMTSEREESVRLEVRQALVEGYLAAARDLRRRHKIRGALGVERILALPGVVQVVSESGADPAAAGETLLEAFGTALDAFEAMRTAEGRRLAEDLSQRLDDLRAETRRVADEAVRQPGLRADGLRERVAALLGDARVDPGRLAQEVAILADRADITEEVVRLTGYLDQAKGLLEEPAGPAGKTLDFVMQEMNREANTIASKSESLAICQAALRIRSIVEAIREQAQNLE
ncbi:MAG TPA: YicC/YloC family endoribonuclease [Patescibacteria group bacterium]|nr:YicC/YloC family endoribonuclease [Patescibacteria group bacterium]